MMRTISVLGIAALAMMLTACQKNENPIKTSAPATATGSTSVTAQTSAPAAAADRDSASAPTPSTHSGAPQADASATAPTARDTPAQKPADALTKAEEANSMPKPGQTDNHFTPSMDGATKGSQQSPGAPPGNPSTGSTVTPSTSK